MAALATSSLDAYAGGTGIARGSAMECAAIIDALVLLNIVDASEREAALVILGRIVAMLTKIRG